MKCYWLLLGFCFFTSFFLLYCLCYFVLDELLLFQCFETGPYSLAQAGLKPMVLAPQSTVCMNLQAWQTPISHVRSHFQMFLALSKPVVFEGGALDS